VHFARISKDASLQVTYSIYAPRCLVTDEFLLIVNKRLVGYRIVSNLALKELM
jgi:hypothetical protein